MNKLLRPGRIIYSIGMAGLGFLCIISKDFIVGRPPAWPSGWDVNPALAYISGTALILSSIAILLKKKAFIAAMMIAILILLLSVLRCLPNLSNDWLNGCKALALLGGTLVVASSFLKDDNEKVSRILIPVGCLCLAIFFIAGGYAHFKFADFVINFIPSYIPFHAFWAYFCGICLIAGGIGILIPQTRTLAALLSAIMLSGWFLLLHIPRFIANTSDASDRMGLCESFTFAGIFFVLAGLSSIKSTAVR